MARALIVVALLALLAASFAAASTPKPDAHDRALAQQLAAKVASLRKLTSTTNSGDDRITKELKGCKALGKTPADSFAVFFAMLPVLLIDLVNEIRPILLDIRNTLAGMHPHDAVFRRWLAAEGAGVGQILSFDNHGKKIDYCAAAKVLLDKKSTARDVHHAIGIDPALIATLFASGTSKSSETLKRINPKMRSFLRAAGVTAKNATALTT